MKRFCDQCGARLDAGRPFCPGCGKPVGAVPAGTGRASTPPPAPDATTTMLSPHPRPATPAPPSPSASAATLPPQPGKPHKGKGGRIALVAIAIIAAIALVIAGIGILGSRQSSDAGAAQPSQEAPASDAAASKDGGSGKSSDDAASKKFAFDKAKLDAIANGAQPAAVALTTADGDAEYASSSAGASKVASGLYLPVYLAATDNGKKPNATASAMLKTMDNDAANQLIDGMGGTGAVNDWLKRNGYEHTELQRHYGDTAASAAGQENTTTAQDAANMLAVMNRIDAAKLMTFDAAKQGIGVPGSMSVHGHSGQGIKDARNYFLVIKDGDRTICVAVLTDGQSKETVADTVTKLLAEIHTEANPENKGEGSQNGSGSGSSDGGSSDKGGSGSTDKGGPNGSGNSDKDAAVPVKLTQSYTTQFGTVNAVTMPALTFGYPDGWTITDQSVIQTVEQVKIANGRGVELSYVYFLNGPSACGSLSWSSDVTKVADASFDAPMVQATTFNLGPFMVASFDDGDGDMLALTPASMQGHHDFYGTPQCSLAFDWPGQRNTSFVVVNSQGGLTAQERREVVAILASLHSA